MRRYVEVLAQRPFALLWTGATVSVLGDGLTWVALVWMVYQITGSAGGIGLLVMMYTAPVIVGGLLAGMALDRFDRRTVLIADNLIRGAVMAVIPVLSYLGALRLWHLYLVAGVYGLFKMVSLAGVPSLIPSLVLQEHLNTANAMESISFGAGGVIGPALGAFMVDAIGGPNVLLVDVLTYFFFAGCLLGVPGSARAPRPQGPDRGGLGPAVRFVLDSPPIRTITVMFSSVNIGSGMLAVLLPVYVKEVLGAGVSSYGFLLSATAIGDLAGSLAVGSLAWPWPLGRSIAAAQVVYGMALLGLLLRPGLGGALALLVTAGLVSAPLTVWAQTIRMRLIPPELRGRVFSLLRTMMQSTPPLGGALAGILLPGAGISFTVAVIGATISGPGALGTIARGLAPDDTRKGRIHDSPSRGTQDPPGHA